MQYAIAHDDNDDDDDESLLRALDADLRGAPDRVPRVKIDQSGKEEDTGGNGNEEEEERNEQRLSLVQRRRAMRADAMYPFYLALAGQLQRDVDELLSVTPSPDRPNEAFEVLLDPRVNGSLAEAYELFQQYCAPHALMRRVDNAGREFDVQTLQLSPDTRVPFAQLVGAVHTINEDRQYRSYKPQKVIRLPFTRRDEAVMRLRSMRLLPVNNDDETRQQATLAQFEQVMIVKNRQAPLNPVYRMLF
jgi:hypothetical protein